MQRQKPSRAKEPAAFRRLAAQHAATQALVTRLSTADVVPAVLRAVCEALHWDEAAFWWVDRDKNVLFCADFWRSSGSTSEFETVTRDMTFAPGVGLPGRVWMSGTPAWIPDVVKDRNFPRAPYAAREGLHGAFGFPVTLTG